MTAAGHQWILLFLAAFFLSLWTTPLAARVSVLLGAIDHPDARKVHVRSVPRLGGLAMVFALAVTLSVFLPFDRRLSAFLLGALIVSAAGFVDDIHRMRPAAKFACEILAAGAFIAVSGASLTGLGDVFGLGEVRTGALAPIVTVFCMVGVMNALNLSDGLDGLAGGLCATACIFLGIFAWLNGDWFSLSLILGIFGAVIGFLRYNTYPATLFMGDTGSLLLGYSLGAVAVLMVQGDGTSFKVTPVMVGTVLALPILDTLVVMLRRIARGVNPFHPDKTHLHHRLMNLGLPHEAVVPILYVSMAAFGFLAWVSQSWREWEAFAAVLLLGGIFYGALILVPRIGDLGRDLSKRERPFERGSAHRALNRWMARSTPVFLWILILGLVLPAVVLGSVTQSVGVIAFAAAGFIAALYPWRSHAGPSSICYGAAYVACVCLLAALHLAPGPSGWIPGYLAGLSVVSLVWVLLKMKFNGHAKAVLTSGFETLLIGSSWILPLVLAPAIGLGAEARHILLLVCLEAISFHMALKILIRKQPQRNYLFVTGLLLALLLIGGKGVLQATDVSASARPPAATASASLPPRLP